MSALTTCFNDLSTIQGVSYNQRQNYKNAWDTFRTVELFNSNVSTLYGNGNTSARYWQYPSEQSVAQYKQGASMFYYYLGYSNIVQKI